MNHEPNPAQQIPSEQQQPTGIRRHVTHRVRMVAIFGTVGLIFFLSAAVAWYMGRPFHEPAPQNLSVKVSSEGFNPATLTVKKGTRITWYVQDQEAHRIASNPYPDNSDFPELDSKTNIGPGGTYSFTFAKSGTYGYHDHLNPIANGTIVVE